MVLAYPFFLLPRVEYSWRAVAYSSSPFPILLFCFLAFACFPFCTNFLPFHITVCQTPIAHFKILRARFLIECCIAFFSLSPLRFNVSSFVCPVPHFLQSKFRSLFDLPVVPLFVQISVLVVSFFFCFLFSFVSYHCFSLSFPHSPCFSSFCRPATVRSVHTRPNTCTSCRSMWSNCCSNCGSPWCAGLPLSSGFSSCSSGRPCSSTAWSVCRAATISSILCKYRLVFLFLFFILLFYITFYDPTLSHSVL